MSNCNSTDAIVSKQYKRFVKDTATFITKCREVHGDLYDYSKVVYVRSSEQVLIICKTHGEFRQAAQSHVSGRGCIKCGNAAKGVSDIDAFIKQATAKHNGRYTYKKSVYIESKVKLCITCPIHGDFMMIPNSHLGGQGCPPCGLPKGYKSRKYSDSQFWALAYKTHGDKFEYDTSKYTGCGRYDYIRYKCPVHGWIKQRAASHLLGHGCRYCSRENKGWTRGDFVRFCNKNNNGDGELYVLKCHGNGESFYKIGITSLTVSSRFSGRMPYSYNVIYSVVDSGSYIYDLENALISLLRDRKYRPSIDFHGITECFGDIKPIAKLLRDLDSNNQLQLLA